MNGWADRAAERTRQNSSDSAGLTMAVLALVEEQQTANMIAYLATGPSSSFPWATARAEIEKRIGLRSAPRR